MLIEQRSWPAPHHQKGEFDFQKSHRQQFNTAARIPKVWIQFSVLMETSVDIAKSNKVPRQVSTDYLTEGLMPDVFPPGIGGP